MAHYSIAEILRGDIPPGSTVTVKGWIRTRRDSKAGLSFLHVSDGSCFAPLQVVAPGELPNYQSEITRLTTGCAIEADGELVASQGKGQKVELKAETLDGLFSLILEKKPEGWRIVHDHTSGG